MASFTLTHLSVHLAAAYGRTATLQGAERFGAAVFPLNLAEYEFIYPENLQAMGEA